MFSNFSFEAMRVQGRVYEGPRPVSAETIHQEDFGNPNADKKDRLKSYTIVRGSFFLRDWRNENSPGFEVQTAKLLAQRPSSQTPWVWRRI